MKAYFLFEFVLILKPVGEILFDGMIRHKVHPLSIVEVSIAVAYLFLPVSKIL